MTHLESTVLNELSNAPLPAKPRIIFMGTPDFAVPSLKALAEWCTQQEAELVAVVSQPDRPKGRGKQLQRTPVAAAADDLGVTCYQWARLSQESYDTLTALNYDLAIVIAYGKILPKRYLVLPPWGCINLHASLLPAYRGAAPIQWALIKGEAQTGVSVMRLDEGMDTGPVAHTLSTELSTTDDAASLFERLSHLSAQALVEALNQWIIPAETSQLVFEAQPTQGASHAPMLKKEDGILDWTQSAQDLVNLCRGISPWPGAQTQTQEGTLKIKTLQRVEEADLEQEQLAYEAGTVIGLHSNGPMIRCGKGAVILSQTQRPSKKATSGGDFYRGYPLTVGKLLSEC